MIEEVQKAIQNPWLVPLMFSHRYYRQIRDNKATSVMNEGWDNLIILDACRFDLFQSVWEGPGKLSSRISMGSDTSEWLTQTFTDEYPDTVYITGNPQVQANGVENRFYKCVNLWESSWDEELNTVLPETMADKTIKIANEFDDKRIISHWIQPHYPFIGEMGSEIEQKTLTGKGVRKESDKLPTIWERLEKGNIDKATVWEAYRENLAIALPHLYELVERLDGLTIITSDHGNVFGRYGLYGHPGRKYIEELVKVPWLVIDGDRRLIREEETNEHSITDEKVKDRLQHLGYR